MCHTAGDDQKAVEQFVKAARLHLDGRNLGAAREAISFALQIRPANAECMDLKRALEEMEARLNVSPPEPKTAAPAPAPVVVPVTPPGSPGGDSFCRPGRGPEEPFQPSAPITRKGLAGITARLRNIKAGGGAAEKGAEGASLAGGEAQPGPAGEAGSDSTGTAPAIRSKGAGIANAASRLKALAGKGGDAPAPGAVPSSGTASGPEGSSTRPAPAIQSKGAGIANAASRLRALAGKNEDPQVTEAIGSSDPTDGKAPTSNADTEELERLRTAIQSGGPVTQAAPGTSQAQAPVPAAPAVPSTGGKTFGK